MLKVKDGVTPKNLVIAAACANAGGEREIVITSGTDGQHMKGSKHPLGDALDIRRSNLTDPELFMSRVQARLGPDYQLVLERTHIHIEYDPRPKGKAARRKGDPATQGPRRVGGGAHR
jgi:conjugal transfer mating pair stabilization protein TraG